MQYAQAKLIQCELLAEECLDITDESRNDWMESLTDEEKGAGWKLNGDHVNRCRLQIDTRKFFAAKLLYKKYGEFVGKDPDTKNNAIHDEAIQHKQQLAEENKKKY